MKNSASPKLVYNYPTYPKQKLSGILNLIPTPQTKNRSRLFFRYSFSHHHHRVFVKKWQDTWKKRFSDSIGEIFPMFSYINLCFSGPQKRGYWRYTITSLPFQTIGDASHLHPHRRLICCPGQPPSRPWVRVRGWAPLKRPQEDKSPGKVKHLMYCLLRIHMYSYMYITYNNIYISKGKRLLKPTKKCIGFRRSSREENTNFLIFRAHFRNKNYESYSYVCHLYHSKKKSTSKKSFHPFLPPFRKKKWPTQTLELFGSLLSRHPNTHLQQQHGENVRNLRFQSGE